MAERPAKTKVTMGLLSKEKNHAEELNKEFVESVWNALKQSPDFNYFIHELASLHHEVSSLRDDLRELSKGLGPEYDIRGAYKGYTYPGYNLSEKIHALEGRVDFLESKLHYLA